MNVNSIARPRACAPLACDPAPALPPIAATFARAIFGAAITIEGAASPLGCGPVSVVAPVRAAHIATIETR